MGGKGRQRYWDDGDMMAAVVPDKRMGGGGHSGVLKITKLAAEERQTKTRALEDDDNYDGNGADKGLMVAGSCLWWQ